MRSGRLQHALDGLKHAIGEVDAALSESRTEQDPLALHIFVSRRRYRNACDKDVKSGHRAETEARMSWATACDLGFRGSLGEWAKLLGARQRR